MQEQPSRRHRAISWVDIQTMRAHASKDDYLQGWADGRYPAPPICDLMNIKLIEFGPGRAVFEGTPGEYHYSPMGTVHGGMLFTLMDSACGIACMSLLPPGTRWSTVNLSISFFRRVTEETGPIRCEGLAAYEGHKIVVVDAVVYSQEGDQLASGRSTCMSARSRPGRER
jgi:uncharacterized protein (TIGR00369 family)